MAIGRRTVLAGSAALAVGGGALIVGYSMSQKPIAIATDGTSLVGHWTFDETEGAVVHDASGHHNDGILVAPIEPGWGIGEFAGSVRLGSIDRNFVSIPASDSLNQLTTALTVTVCACPNKLWTVGDTYDGHIALVQRQWRRELHPDLFYLGYGPRKSGLTYKWHVGLEDAEPSFYERTEAHTPTVGKWVHIAGVYDGGTGEMSLYVDGELIVSATHKGRIRLDSESLERPVMIGAELNSGSRSEISGPFDGHIDDVRIYDRALSAAEIATLASEAKARHPEG